jgi:hypothetical protein
VNMGAKRGAENLQRFNAERSAQLAPLLAHELQLCRKRKLEFKSVGLLAAYLSDRLKVHRTTFLRNLQYRASLLAYLSSQPGVVGRTPDTTLEPAILQAKLSAARLEASNLRQDIKRLNALLARHEGVSGSDGGDESSVDFGNVAMLLVNVLSRVGDSIIIDYAQRSIIDLAAKPSDRILAGPERAGPFIAWLEQNQILPAVRLLKGLPEGVK